MPIKLISCVSLPSATITSVPIYDFAGANAELANETMEAYYPCCGKSVCKACIHSFHYSGNDKCPFCNSDRGGKTVEDAIKDIRKRVESNDAASIYVLGSYYEHGGCGLQQDRTKSIELYARAADLGSSTANYNLAHIYHEGGDLKKAKFHREAAAMAGHEMARFDLGIIELKSSNMERAMKHCTISASNGSYRAMHALRTFFEQGLVSRESIDSTLATYNNSCAEMRSEARDVYIQFELDT
jgi:TPR repeat protein